MDLTSRVSRIFTRLALATTSTVVLGAILIVVFATPRGFDWSDESWGYSLILNNQQTPREPWGFQHLLHPLFALLGESVLLFRVLRLIGYITVGLAAGFSFLRLANAMSWKLGRSQQVFLLVAAQFGTIHAYSYPPRIVSYNEVSSWIIQLFLTFVILLYSWQRLDNVGTQRINAYNSCLLGIGLFLPLQFATRFTTFILQIPLLIVALAVISSNTKSLTHHIRWISGGMATGIALLIAIEFPLSHYLQSLQQVFLDEEVQRGYGHSIEEILKVYKASVLDAFHQSRAVYATLLLLLVLGLVGKRINKVRDLLIVTSTLLVVFTIDSIQGWARDNNWRLLGSVFALLFVLLIVAVFMILRREQVTQPLRQNLRLYALFAMLIIGPTSVAIGTNNPITGQFLSTSTIWVTYVVGITLVLMSSSAGTHLMSVAVALSLVLVQLGLVSLAAFKRDVTVHSYRTPAYFTQDHRSKVPFLRGIYLTQQEAEWSDWISRTSSELGAAHVPTVAIDAPGALLVFNNSDVASPWISSFWPGSLLTISDSCRHSELKDTKFFVIQDDAAQIEDSWWTSVSAEFAKCDIQFPADFKIAAQRTSARVTQGNTTVWLYEPEKD